MKTIALVDDDRYNTILIRKLLEMDGVIDCNLAQGEDGIDLLLAIRNGKTDANSNVPVIMTSGDDRRLPDAERAGATLFLIKPYSPRILSAQLSELLEVTE